MDSVLTVIIIQVSAVGAFLAYAIVKAASGR